MPCSPTMIVVLNSLLLMSCSTRETVPLTDVLENVRPGVQSAGTFGTMT